MEQAELENVAISPVPTDWLNPVEQVKRQSDQVSEEVNRRVREELNLTIQDNNTLHQNWKKNVNPTAVVPKVQVPDGIVLSESESESESDLPQLTPRRYRKTTSRGSRRQPSRKSKTGISYKGMFALFGQQADISEEITSAIVESDCAYLSTLDLNGLDFTSTPATRSLQRE